MNNWQQKFKQEFGIHFKNSPDELKFALSFIDDLMEEQRQEIIDEVEKMIRVDLGINYGSPGEEAWDWFAGELPPFEDFISHFKSRLKEKLKNL